MSQVDYTYQDIWLTTREAVKRRLINAGNTANWTSAENTSLDELILQASADVITELGWLPLPYTNTLLIDYSDQYISRNSKTLWVTDAPLLELTTLTNGDGQTIASSKYTLSPNNRYPKTSVRLVSTDSTCFKSGTSGKWEQVISIAGVFGYVPQYTNAWVSTGDTVQDDPLLVGATTLNVSDASANGFEVGQYLKISSEIMLLTSINDNALSIERGVLGTTAVEHTMGTAIQRFRHITAIQKVVTEWATYLWKGKDQVGEQIQFFNDGVTISQGLAPRVYNDLMRHSKWQAVQAS